MMCNRAERGQGHDHHYCKQHRLRTEARHDIMLAFEANRFWHVWLSFLHKNIGAKARGNIIRNGVVDAGGGYLGSRYYLCNSLQTSSFSFPERRIFGVTTLKIYPLEHANMDRTDHSGSR